MASLAEPYRHSVWVARNSVRRASNLARCPDLLSVQVAIETFSQWPRGNVLNEASGADHNSAGLFTDNRRSVERATARRLDAEHLKGPVGMKRNKKNVFSWIKSLKTNNCCEDLYLCKQQVYYGQSKSQYHQFS